jgi:hypothetical protein
MAELDCPVKQLDSCAPLRIPIGKVPLSLYVREEALLAPALRRYREFQQSCENGLDCK